MPKNYDDDRPKKSWREKDRNKDSSSHRKEDRPIMNKNKQARADSASKTYKSKLDSFFDGSGKMPEHVQQKLTSIESVEGKKRKEAADKIKNSATSLAKTKAVAEFLQNWEMPPDYEFLSEVLSCSEDNYIETAINLIEEMLAANRVPKRGKLLEQRLRRVVMLGEDPDLQDLAGVLIKKLRPFLG